MELVKNFSQSIIDGFDNSHGYRESNYELEKRTNEKLDLTLAALAKKLAEAYNIKARRSGSFRIVLEDGDLPNTDEEMGELRKRQGDAANHIRTALLGSGLSISFISQNTTGGRIYELFDLFYRIDRICQVKQDDQATFCYIPRSSGTPEEILQNPEWLKTIQWDSNDYQPYWCGTINAGGAISNLNFEDPEIAKVVFKRAQENAAVFGLKLIRIFEHNGDVIFAYTHALMVFDNYITKEDILYGLACENRSLDWIKDCTMPEQLGDNARQVIQGLRMHKPTFGGVINHLECSGAETVYLPEEFRNPDHKHVGFTKSAEAALIWHAMIGPIITGKPASQKQNERFAAVYLRRHPTVKKYIINPNVKSSRSKVDSD